MSAKRPLVIYDGELEEIRVGDTISSIIAPGSGGGGGGSQQVFVQLTRPVEVGPWIWYQIDINNNVIDCTINDGL